MNILQALKFNLYFFFAHLIPDKNKQAYKETPDFTEYIPNKLGVKEEFLKYAKEHNNRKAFEYMQTKTGLSVRQINAIIRKR